MPTRRKSVHGGHAATPRGLAARQQLAGLTRESDWQKTINDALESTGWTWLHVDRAKVPQRGSKGAGKWITPTKRGFPDNLGLRDGFLLVIENKKVGEYPTAAQRVWLELFHLVPGSLVWVSRPSDPWSDLEDWLRHPESAPRLHGWEPAQAKAERLAKGRKR